MFINKRAKQAYIELQDAIDEAKIIPACQTTDPELWFGDESGQNQYRIAKRLCDQCPVKAQCLAFAMANNEEYGMWGGTSRRERERLGSRAR